MVVQLDEGESSCCLQQLWTPFNGFCVFQPDGMFNEPFLAGVEFQLCAWGTTYGFRVYQLNNDECVENFDVVKQILHVETNRANLRSVGSNSRHIRVLEGGIQQTSRYVEKGGRCPQLERALK